MSGNLIYLQNSVVFLTQLTLSSYQVYGTFCQKQQQPPITRGQPFSQEIDKFTFCVLYIIDILICHQISLKRILTVKTSQKGGTRVTRTSDSSKIGTKTCSRTVFVPSLHVYLFRSFNNALSLLSHLRWLDVGTVFIQTKSSYVFEPHSSIHVRYQNKCFVKE